MIDRYTKAVLTCIALVLTVLAAQNLFRAASAETSGRCGDAPSRPCWVAVDPKHVLSVTTDPQNPMWVAAWTPIDVKIKQRALGACCPLLSKFVLYERAA